MFAKLAVSRRVSVLVAFLVALYGVSATGQSAAAPLTLTAPAAPKASASVAAPAAEEESAPLKNDASHQGVKVHGHWKIVVKNPDGSIAETRDFENSLVTGVGGGGSVLSILLGGVGSSGGLLIDLNPKGGGTSICGKTDCAIVASTTTGAGAVFCTGSGVSCATGLTTTIGSTLVLAGQLTASQTGNVGLVNTYAAYCFNATTAPSSCSAASTDQIAAFTSTGLATAISVNSGQIVQVTVTISFS